MLTRELLLERQIIHPEIADQWANTVAIQMTRGGWGLLNDDYVASPQDAILEEWCRRVLRNWILRDYQGVERVGNPSDYQYYHPDHTPFGGAEDVEPPEWLIKGLEAGQEFYALPNLPGTLPREIEQIKEKAGEILRSLIGQMEQRGQPQEQIRQRILRLSVPAMLDLWQREHDRIARAAEKARRLGRDVDGSGVKIIVPLPGGLAAYEFVTDQPPSEPSRTLRMALRNETIEMGICVGDFRDPEALRGGYGQQYAEGVEDGTKRIFSLRDAQGASHVTIDTTNGHIDQVKGKENKPPVAKYIPDTIEFLNHLGLPSRSGDLRELGVFERNGRYSTDFREVAVQVLTLDDGTEVWEIDSPHGLRLWFLHPQGSGQTASEPYFALGLTQREDGSQPYINDVDRHFGSGTEPIRKNMDLILPVLNDGTYRPTPSWAEYIATAGCIQDPETRRWGRYEDIATLVKEIGEFKSPGHLGRTAVYRLYRYADRFDIMSVYHDHKTGEDSLWRTMTIIVRRGRIAGFQDSNPSRLKQKAHAIIVAALNTIGFPIDPFSPEIGQYGVVCSGNRYGQSFAEVGTPVMRFEGDHTVYRIDNGTNKREQLYVLLDQGIFVALVRGEPSGRAYCTATYERTRHGYPPPRESWRYIKLLCQKAGLTLAGPTEMVGL